MRVLVVQPNRALANLIHDRLIRDGHHGDVVNHGQPLLREPANCRYDLVLLDGTLPDADGVDICRALRTQCTTQPILMFSPNGHASERVRCLEAGADDCLSKPFDVGELLARVRAFERRCEGASSTVRSGPLVLNRLERLATLDGQRLDLTPREFDLLTYLASVLGHAVSRGELLQKVWHIGFDIGSNVVDAHIKKVREKLGPFSGMIQTERRVGYRLVSVEARELSQVRVTHVAAITSGAHPTEAVA